MPFEKVESHVDFPARERATLRFWDERQIFDKLRAKNRGKPRWSFLDGPITANNPMGVHHAWGRTYKDAYQRYFAMTGHDDATALETADAVELGLLVEIMDNETLLDHVAQRHPEFGLVFRAGKGDGAAGLALTPPPADLTQHAIVGIHPDGQLFAWITDGYPGSAMPAFVDRLSETERWQIVNLVRTLAR